MTLLSVNKGDSINLNVNANYETTPSGNGWLETAHSVLFNALNTSYGEVIEGGVATSEWSDALNGVQMSPKHETSDAPRAFLNYILFDQNMNYVTAGFEQLSTAAHGVGVHETLSMDGIVAEQEGYILAYLSNENAEPVNVHFDDFTVTQTKTKVVSSQDYYPFGGTFNSFTRNYSEPQRFKYNGKELEEETGWSDFGARQYDRWSGRWMGMDPLGDLRNWVSPYNFVQNNPINRVDPDGALDREIRSLTVINRVERIDGEEMMDKDVDDWVERANGDIYWDENATSQETTKAGETYLGKNVLVGTHNRGADGNEVINTAQFDLYLESDKTSPSATIMGNTVPADITKYGTLAEGLYPARFQGRASYLRKGKDDLAVIINEGKNLPTVNGNPNKANSDMLSEVFIHAGNYANPSLFTRSRNPISAGCQTTGCGEGTRPLHNAFMRKVGRDFNGYYYLRAKPVPTIPKVVPSSDVQGS